MLDSIVLYYKLYWYSNVNHKCLINGLYIGLLMLIDIYYNSIDYKPKKKRL